MDEIKRRIDTLERSLESATFIITALLKASPGQQISVPTSILIDLKTDKTIIHKEVDVNRDAIIYKVTDLD